MSNLGTVEAARGRWPGILQALGLDPKYLHNIDGPCPMCGGNRQRGWISWLRITAFVPRDSCCANCVGIVGMPSPKALTGRHHWTRFALTSHVCGVRRLTCNVDNLYGMYDRGGKVITIVRRR